MQALEQLLIDQRVKGNSLANQLSAAQDRIGGVERRAQQLTEENKQIKSELNYWNELYAQENEPEHVGEQNEEVESAPPQYVTSSTREFEFIQFLVDYLLRM